MSSEYFPDSQEGDYFLVKTDHFVSKLIRFGQRSYGKDAAQWNHVALYIGDEIIVEALTNGVVESYIDKYSKEDLQWHSVMGPRPVTPLMRAYAVGFARSCVGERYGWTTILAIALKTIFKGKFNFGVQGTSICSGLVARSLEREGFNFNPYDPAELTPAYLAKI